MMVPISGTEILLGGGNVYHGENMNGVFKLDLTEMSFTKLFNEEQFNF